MFLFFFLLNLISNFAFLFYDDSLWAIFCMVGCAGLIGFVEDLLVSKISYKRLSLFIIALLSIFNSSIILGDYFLVTNFKMWLNQDAVDILAETNAGQTADFINSYLTISKVLLWLSLIVLVNLIALFLNNYFSSGVSSIKWLTVMMGLIASSISFYSFAKYRDGKSVPQYVAPARLSYSVYVLKQRLSSIADLRSICSNVTASTDIEHAPDVIVIIGESFSKYHCSLYGYTKTTYPLLEARKGRGELLVMDNAIAIADATHRNMQSIFSLDGADDTFRSSPLFPACFKAAGYKTMMYDNQFFVGQGISFLSDDALSKEMFNLRNANGFTYDGEMISTLQKEDWPSLYVIHLWGHHYLYENRYPKDYSTFSPHDYADTKHSSIIAHYDNACVYNDFVIDEIIRQFEDDDAVLVYFSDHGEEVYEMGFMGHGTSTTTKDIRYQIDVPFIVWASEKFRSNHEDIIDKLEKSRSTPIMTKDVSHFLLDLANIQTPQFNAERSFINDSYIVNHHRKVMNSIDYDEAIKKYKNPISYE